jgi:hypothetical protein
LDKKVKNRKRILYTTLEVVVIMIMTMVGNMWDWVNMEFRPDLIGTSAFWEDTIVKATLYSGSLILAILLKLSKLELEDIRYDDLLGKYRGKLDIKENNTEAFDTYLEKTLNPRIKKEYIRTKLERKLYRIQKHERDSWAMDYFQAKDSGELENYLFSSKWSRRYFIKRTRIEAMLDKDFIEKHWMNMSVKCPRVSSTQFGYYLEIGRNRDERYKLNNEVVKDVVKQGTLKVITVFFISICMTIMALSPQTNQLLEQANGWIVLLIQYIIRVVMICLSFATGIWTAKRTFDDNYLLPLTNRIDILDDFRNWLDTNPVKVKGVQAIKEEVEAQLKAQLEKEYSEKLEKSKKEIQEQAIKLVEDFQKANDVKGGVA